MTSLLPHNLFSSYPSLQFGFFCYAVQSFASRVISQVPLMCLLIKRLSKVVYFPTSHSHSHTHTHTLTLTHHTHTHTHTHSHSHTTHTHTHTHTPQQQELFSSQAVQSWAATIRREMLQHAENCFQLALGLKGTKHAEPWLYCLMLGKTRYKLGQPAANTLQHLLKVIIL